MTTKQDRFFQSCLRGCKTCQPYRNRNSWQKWVFFPIQLQVHKGSPWTDWHRIAPQEPSNWHFLAKGEQNEIPQAHARILQKVALQFFLQNLCRNVSFGVIDIGGTISLIASAGNWAAAPRLIPAVSRPLILAKVLLRASKVPRQVHFVQQTIAQQTLKV